MFFFRNMAIGSTTGVNEDMNLFRKLREEGKLNDQEFADLKSSIPKEIPALNSIDKKNAD